MYFIHGPPVFSILGEYGKCFTFDPGTLHPETVGNDGPSSTTTTLG